jgi:hypothetical protein
VCRSKWPNLACGIPGAWALDSKLWFHLHIWKNSPVKPFGNFFLFIGEGELDYKSNFQSVKWFVFVFLKNWSISSKLVNACVWSCSWALILLVLITSVMISPIIYKTLCSVLFFPLPLSVSLSLLFVCFFQYRGLNSGLTP